MKIIVLSKTDYKEKDAIITAISEESLISFKVRNARVSNSAFTWLNNPLTIAEVEFIENPRYVHKILKNAKLLYTPLVGGDSYDNLLAINFVNEVATRLLPDEDKHLLFHEIENFFIENKNNKDLQLSEIVLLSKVAKIAGFGLQVNECAVCGKKNDIVAFSFSEGGFLCRNCVREDTELDLSPQQMKQIRYLINVEHYSDLINDKANENINIADKKFLMAKFVAFIEQVIGVHLNTTDLILKK